MKKPISEQTRLAILEATWTLIAEKKRLDVGQAEIAAAAGVSRQTVYLAFGNRAGLLTAMVRHRDTLSDHVARLHAISSAGKIRLEDFGRYFGIWLDYLQLVYPVAVLLEAAALTEVDAAAAWDDRMKGALLAGLKRIFAQLAKNGDLAAGCDAAQAAELVWSLAQPASVRHLVAGCGWSYEEFRRSRIEIVQSAILKPGRRLVAARPSGPRSTRGPKRKTPVGGGRFPS
jgi:AcrR family transcriptional regulator